MFIERIHIDSFGKLADIDIELDRRVNIIEGDNESGKSTIASFIKFILYGVPPKERSGLVSWNTGGASGSVTVNDGDKRYRIERAIVGNRENMQFIDADTNLLIRHALEGTTPGEFLLGVNAEIFSATAFVSQLGGVSAGGSKLSEGIENLLFSADENVNAQRASSKLDSARASLLHKNGKGGRLFEMDEKCARMEVRLSNALNTHEVILAKESQLADSKEKLDAAQSKADEIAAKVDCYEAGLLLGLFERRRNLENEGEKLAAQIKASGAENDISADELETDINRLSLFENELNEAALREAEAEGVQENPLLDEYLALGGRGAVEDECSLSRTRSKSYRAIGVISLILGFLLAGMGVLPMIFAKQPQLVLALSGAVLAALAVSLFVLASRSRKNADELMAKFDLDALDAELKKRSEAKEIAVASALAASMARQRYDSERQTLREKYGCEPEELNGQLDKLKEELTVSIRLKSEFDKNATLISQMNEQLKQYNEDDLRVKLNSPIDMDGIDAESLPELRRERDFSLKIAQSLEKRCNELDRELAGLYPTLENPTALADSLNSLKTERETLRKKHAAYKLAANKLAQASESLRRGVAPRLASDAAGMMAKITDGKYREIGVGADLEMNAVTSNGLKSIDLLSAGTQDAAYLSLRMALVTLLYRRTLPPTVFDEAFSRQDDTRLSNLLRLVSLQKTQSIIFTSNGREVEAMSKLGSFNLIRL